MFGINLYQLEKHHLKLNKSNNYTSQKLSNSLLNYDILVNNTYTYNLTSIEKNYLNHYQIYKYLFNISKIIN